MGNLGGIERLMVFGILLIIITILAIAFFSAYDDEDPYTTGSQNGSQEGDLADTIYRDDITTNDPFPRNSGSTGAPLDSIESGASTSDSNQPASQLPLRSNLNRDSNRTDNTSSAELTDRGSRDRNSADGIISESTAQVRTYKIQSGDSFARIARQVYGHEKWCKEIEKANPSLDPRKLQVGTEIFLPEIEIATKVSETGSGGNAFKKGSKDAQSATLSDGSLLQGNIYTVEKSDTLIKIAEKVWGERSEWKRIYEANRDVLLDPDSLIPGMQLRIP